MKLGNWRLIWVIVSPKRNRSLGTGSRYYGHRNGVERLFRRLKGFRRIFTCFEKLDSMFWAFICPDRRCVTLA
jgi:transposase